MRVVSRRPAETIKAGYNLGRRLKSGDAVCLYGELGSGKTTFVKGIAKALLIDEKEITSASFIIISEHKGKSRPLSGRGAFKKPLSLYHIDLYRIENGNAEDTGIYDYIGADGVAVIEWADRMEEPEGCVKVRINFAPEGGREIIIEEADEKGSSNM